MKYVQIYKNEIFKILLPYKLEISPYNEEKRRIYTELILNNNVENLDEKHLKNFAFYHTTEIIRAQYYKEKNNIQKILNTINKSSRLEQEIYIKIYELVANTFVNNLTEEERKLIRGIEKILYKKPKSFEDLLKKIFYEIHSNVYSSSKEEIMDYIKSVKKTSNIPPNTYILTKEDVLVELEPELKEILKPRNKKYNIYTLEGLLRELFEGFPNIEEIIKEFKWKDLRKCPKLKKIYNTCSNLPLKELRSKALEELKENKAKTIKHMNYKSYIKIDVPKKIKQKKIEKYEIMTYDELSTLPNKNYIGVVSDNIVDIYRYEKEGTKKIHLFVPKKRQIYPINLREIEELICKIESIDFNRTKIYIHR